MRRRRALSQTRLRGSRSAHPSVSFDHLIGARQQPARNGELECLYGLAIDDELELDRSLHREIAGLGPVENPIHIGGRATIEGVGGHPIVHETAAPAAGSEHIS